MGVHGSPRRGRLSDVRQFLLISALAGAIVAAMALPFVGGAAFATKQATLTFESLPTELKKIPLPQRTYIRAADGTIIATLYDENRVVVPLAKISPLIQQAVIATEDTRFFEHHGVDVKGSLRAILANSQAGETQQGSSTVTMQYVRNLLITNAKTSEEIELARARTMARKVQEMRYALAIEKRLTKNEILQGYLNVSYFGAGAYGVEAAAQRYFRQPASNVTLPQAATLAGLVQQPVGYDPTRNPHVAELRRNIVLDRMAGQNFITRAQAAAAKATPIAATLKPTAPDNGCAVSPYPFYCDYVVNQITNDPKYGASFEAREGFLKQGGIVINTGMDMKAMTAANDAVRSYIPVDDESKKAAAIAMVQPGTGNVLALTENRDWGTEGTGKTTYNYAVNAADGGTIGMQAGSVFKAFTLAAALEKGISPSERIYSPQTKTFSSGTWGCDDLPEQPEYEVNNSTGSGTFDMWSGTAFSINTFFVELQREAGLCRTVDIAERLGVTLANGGRLNRYPSVTLGSMEVSPLAVAAAYAGLANHGIYCKPHAVTSITTLSGQTLSTETNDCKVAVGRGVADGVTALLSGVIDGDESGRTGRDMSLGRDAAGKTGTTDTSAAVWFAGYTPDLAAAVWAGDPRGGFKHPMDNVTIDGVYYDEVHGSSIPGPIWREAMSGALSDSEPQYFDLDAAFDLKAAREGGYQKSSRYDYSDDYDYDY